MNALRLALVGAPNCGKSTLFNGLTGGRAKAANYPGVTVETRSGHFTTPAGRPIDLMDLPGIYGLNAQSADERVALEVLQGRMAGKEKPQGLIVLIDAALLRTHLHTVLQFQSLGYPMVVVLNMFDLAERDGMQIDVAKLEASLGVPVIPTVSTRKAGREAFLRRLDAEIEKWAEIEPVAQDTQTLRQTQQAARKMAAEAILFEPPMNRITRGIDQVVMHPLAGPLVLLTILFLMFQAVYSWAEPFMEAIEAGAAHIGAFVGASVTLPWLHDLLVDGVIAGVGSVLVFLPQIIILFIFILSLEASGYMARAAVMMDELMLRVGLNGRAFIPLLSSFACAIPGIMAARSIDSERDRLTTILVAPLMTCSARLPVYTLIIGAFIPPETIGLFNQQGLVLFGLYIAGIFSAIIIAFVLKRTATRGSSQTLILELPTYKLPTPRDFFLNLWMRIWAFLKRAGTIILSTSVVLWFLARYPTSATSLKESYAGMIGSWLEKVLAPIGFNLEISIALVPGMAAREVAVGALGTVYAVQGGEENTAGLADVLQSAWSMPTALAFLAWYVFAPQCFATLATARRETNSWRWTAFMFGYLFSLAYIMAGLTYHLASALGL
ncbi:MAG: ferrous iron transporter B [Alphaproteobacteria bacterium]|nr:MAG: ferrous iron transporter B [Alphaproteobacteria bacterium]